MKYLLVALEKLLVEKGLKSYSYLKEGISKLQVNEILRVNSVTFSFPEEVYDLYQWHNGQKGMDDITFIELDIFLNGIFYPIEYALEMYNSYNGYIDENLFPLFGNGDTIHKFIDLDKNSNEYGYIKYYSNEDIVPITMYPSLSALVNCLIECYETGAYHADANGKFEMEDTSTAIQKKYGAGCEYWNNVR